MNQDAEYHHGSHCVFLTQYQIIWCPKYRFNVLSPIRQRVLKDVLREICTSYHYTVKAVEIMPDHIHLFVDLPHTTSPAEAVRTLKSLSARRMFEIFQDLKAYYHRCGKLWSRGYYISSVGHVSEQTVKRYIEEQHSNNH